MQSNTNVLPFIARVEVFDDGAWMPEAQGSTIAWLREARDEALQVYERVRVVAWWGEEISIDGEGI